MASSRKWIYIQLRLFSTYHICHPSPQNLPHPSPFNQLKIQQDIFFIFNKFLKPVKNNIHVPNPGILCYGEQKPFFLTNQFGPYLSAFGEEGIMPEHSDPGGSRAQYRQEKYR